MIIAAEAMTASSRLTATRIVIALGIMWLLIGPRFDLLSIGGSSVRAEDGVFVVFVALSVLHRRRIRLRGLTVVALSGLLVVGIVSALVGSASGRISFLPGLLYTLRPLEYATVYPAGILLLRGASRRWQKSFLIGLAVCTAAECTTSMLQIYAQVPVGYGPPSFVRATGLTNGPYELGAIAAALLIFWAARRSWIGCLAAIVPLWLSGSRISLIGSALGLLILTIDHVVRRRRPHSRTPGRARRRILTAAAAVALLLVGAAMLPSVYEKSIEPSFARLGQTSISAAWTRGAEIADRQPTVETAERYKRVALDDPFPLLHADQAVAEGLDLSNILRFFKWKLALDAMTRPGDAVIGLGPSFVGPAMDGNLLRFYVEGGVIGVLAWTFLIVSWFRRRPWWLRSVLIAYLTGALFIDVFASLRSMVLLWVLVAISETLGAPLPLGRRSRRASHLDRADTQQISAIDPELLSVLRSSRTVEPPADVQRAR